MARHEPKVSEIRRKMDLERVEMMKWEARVRT